MTSKYQFCNHDFHYVCFAPPNQEYPMYPIGSTSMPIMPLQPIGARVVCAYCGQVRDLYADGTVKIAVREGVEIWPKDVDTFTITPDNGTPITDKNTTGGQR